MIKLNKRRGRRKFRGDVHLYLERPTWIQRWKQTGEYWEERATW